MHDKFGNPLVDGDVVLVEAVITSHNSGEEYCNVNLETVEPMYPSENKTTLVLNAKQIMKARKNPHAPGGVVILGETLGPGKEGGEEPPPDQPPSQGGGN